MTLISVFNIDHFTLNIFKGHFEGADRIKMILDKLRSSGLVAPVECPLVRELDDFPRADFVQLRRAHSDE